MDPIFDAMGYLEARNIPHWTSGKNVTAGWVNIQCPYLDCDDSSNHLGINLSTGVHSCWKCGGKGGPAKLIMALENCDFALAAQTIIQYSLDLWDVPVSARGAAGSKVVDGKVLPAVQATLPNPHLRYLIKRGFNPNAIINKYRVAGVYNTGDRRYRMRIIIPIYMDGQLVSFTARAIDDRIESKYRMPPDEEALIPGHTVLYNLDNVRNGVCALVEGALDVWRIGDGAVGVMRVNYTEEQLSLLPLYGIHTVYVIYDAGATKLAEELASKVSKLISNTYIITLPHGDPATANPADLQYIKGLLRTT